MDPVKEGGGTDMPGKHNTSLSLVKRFDKLYTPVLKGFAQVRKSAEQLCKARQKDSQQKRLICWPVKLPGLCCKVA